MTVSAKEAQELIKYNIEMSGNKHMMEMAIKNLSSKGSCVLAGNIKHGLKIKFNPYELIFGKQIHGFSGNDLSLDKNIYQYFCHSEFLMQLMYELPYHLKICNLYPKDLVTDVHFVRRLTP